MKTFVSVPIFKGDSVEGMPTDFKFEVPVDGDYSFVISGDALSVVIDGSLLKPTRLVEAVIVAQTDEIPHGYKLQFPFSFGISDADGNEEDEMWFGVCTKDNRTVAYAWKKQF